MKRWRVLVIGAVAVDVKAQSFGELTPQGDVPGRVRINPGGVARNLALNLARLGAEVTLLSVIGADEFGRLVRADLARAGVNLAHVLVTQDRPTATWVGVLDAGGDLAVGVFGGEIFDTLTPHVIQAHAALFADVDLVACDATLARATTDAVIAVARANRVPLYLNPASVARALTIADCLGTFDLVTANALEAQALGRSGEWADCYVVESAECVAREWIARGARRVIITLGAEGVVYADACETRHAPALPLRVVDTTGAGDALAAMFVLCHLQNVSLDQTLVYCQRAAALTAACAESVSAEGTDFAVGVVGSS